MHTLDLTPLFRSTIGFDRFNNLFENALRGDEAATNYPPYNIEKLGEDEYRVVIAVAGFKEADLNIVLENNVLTVSGRSQQEGEKEKVQYLHKGIGTRAFERKFSLADHVKVTGASLADGLLAVQLQREIPEAQKPRMIAINGQKAINGRKAS